MKQRYAVFWAFLSVLLCATAAFSDSEQLQRKIYQVGELKPVDSQCKLKVGDRAPGFTLPSISGERVSLSAYAGKKNVVISFVPAAWTPVCSNQWPAYNIAKSMAEKNDAVIIGISVDNIPSLYAWTVDMGGVWFPVLSDFWPHGETAKQYGVLRSSGTCERALFIIDKRGRIRYIDVHDINEKPNLETLITELQKLNK
ncbi:MAG: peroxiredoxin [Syntrophobacteraceae bacterium]|jgi:peroxiredoxin (alkyl hydroperoxide reductase subunit C)